MANIINAIENLIKLENFTLKHSLNLHNRANSLGDSLENFISALFCGNTKETNYTKILKKQEKIFSYIGNSSNPPDFILKNGDAIEVKKIENFNSSIALNSSYPKAKLYANSPMITKHCKECEIWNEKDMIYAVGVVNQNLLKSLIFVYGEDYAAEFSIYERVKNAIKIGIENIPETKFSTTKELGRVNKVDPLGVTNLRIRGMWHIENPLKVFDYIYTRDESKTFSFATIINHNKFNSFSNTNSFIELINSTKGANIKDVYIKNPNNPARTIDAKLITYEI